MSSSNDDTMNVGQLIKFYNTPSSDNDRMSLSQSNKCYDLLTEIDRQQTKNEKNKLLSSLLETLKSIKTYDTDDISVLRRHWTNYKIKKIQIGAMPEDEEYEAISAAAGGSRKRRSIKPRKSRKTKPKKSRKTKPNKSRKTKSRKSRKTKSRKTKSRRH